jgi:Spy/CpxP family protein refolding chaperone
MIGMALLVAAFVAGGLAGAAFSRVLQAREPAAAGGAACERSARGRGPSTKLLEEVDLTPRQRQRIEGVMATTRTRIDAFWKGDEGRRMRGIVDSARAEIRGVLTPDQRAEYDRLVAEHRARRRHKEGPAAASPEKR